MNKESQGDYLVVFCTCPSAETAQQLAHLIIERRCAACVNIVPNLTSVYRWEGKIAQSAENLLIIKTHASRYKELEATLHTHHEYQIPEIIALPIQLGLNTYLDWIEESLI